MIKEGDLAELKKCRIKYEYLYQSQRQFCDFIDIASQYRHQAILDYLYQNIIIPFYAINENSVDVFKTDMNQKTLLHWAAAANQWSDINLLVENGANVNAANNSGATPLYFAV